MSIPRCSELPKTNKDTETSADPRHSRTWEKRRKGRTQETREKERLQNSRDFGNAKIEIRERSVRQDPRVCGVKLQKCRNVREMDDRDLRELTRERGKSVVFSLMRARDIQNRLTKIMLLNTYRHKARELRSSRTTILNWRLNRECPNPKIIRSSRLLFES